MIHLVIGDLDLVMKFTGLFLEKPCRSNISGRNIDMAFTFTKQVHPIEIFDILVKGDLDPVLKFTWLFLVTQFCSSISGRTSGMTFTFIPQVHLVGALIHIDIGDHDLV